MHENFSSYVTELMKAAIIKSLLHVILGGVVVKVYGKEMEK